MEMVNTPDAWVIVKIEHRGLENPLYKVVAGWNGGYLHGNSWRVNSGITSVEEWEDYFVFHGASGSNYTCHKLRYGMKVCNYPGLERLRGALERVDGTAEVMDENTNWKELDYKLEIPDENSERT
jgi:hypothetical protein